MLHLVLYDKHAGEHAAHLTWPCIITIATTRFKVMLLGVGSHHGLIRPCNLLHQLCLTSKTNLQVFRYSWQSLGVP